ncbi:hypothetical protein Dalk_2898 [Desulfatibacillum aliphaticivorans]|uniref:Uncharacterized protein n=1 Tax=Desulfatibacillum aliphaticivorans TaxID=218208 RepID=B8FBE4_DESAL|nr:hypothetical protein Dalk_2898 [Desulfatibacillum aliphaticivorans]
MTVLAIFILFALSAVVAIILVIMNMGKHDEASQIQRRQLSKQLENPETRCTRCQQQDSFILGELGPGIELKFYFLIFRLKNRKWKYIPFFPGLNIYPNAICCLNCGMVLCPSDPKAVKDYFRRFARPARPDEETGEFEKSGTCRNCGESKAAPGSLKVKSPHNRRLSLIFGLYFSPGHLKERMTFPTGVETAGAILACSDCGTIFLEVDPFKLVAFIKAKCEPDYAASVLKEAPPPPPK